MTSTTCRCGHARAAHLHYRRGTDCAACGCPAYRRAVGFRRSLGRALGLLRR